MNTKHLRILRLGFALAVSLALAAALLAVVGSAMAVPRLGIFTRVTTASQSNRDSEYPSLNGDGTLVAFESDSDLLNEGREDNVFEIWLYDTATMTYTRVTTSWRGEGNSYGPNVNGDGTVVAFASDADLFNVGSQDSDEVYLYDRATMTITHVTTGSHPGRNSSYPSLNEDGTAFAFYGDSDFLNEGRPPGISEIWLYDTATITYTRVTSASHADRDSGEPSLSDDGAVVAFHSDSDLLDQGIPDGQNEVWLYDTATMTYTRVTSASLADRDSRWPSLNEDGTVVAFVSDSDLLDEDIPAAQYEIWLYDTATMTFTRITTATDSERDSWYPSLSDDGTVVAFFSDSDLLNEGRPDNVDEIWLYDTKTMTYTRVTSASHADRDSWYPSLSGDGTVVAFESDSDLLNGGIEDEQWEIWLWREADEMVSLPLVAKNH